jgi:hypothetical protein
MRDDDELRPLGELPEQLDEAPDVGVVEGGLDFVQEVERARPREEEREEEGNRAQSLLAAREEREPRHALARRLELDLDPRLLPALLAFAPDESTRPAREERARHLGEVALDRSVGLLEEPLDGCGEVVAELRELFERAFEVFALRCQLLQPFFLPRVLFGGERVDLAQRFATALEALDLSAELFDLLVGEGLGAFTLGQSRNDVLALALESCRLYGDRGKPLAGFGGGAANLDLPGAEGAKLLAQLSAAASARVHPRPKRRLEAKRALRRGVEKRGHLLGLLAELEEEARVGPGLRPRLRLGAGGEPQLVAGDDCDCIESGRLRELEALAGLGCVSDLGAVPSGGCGEGLLESRSRRRRGWSRSVGPECACRLFRSFAPEFDALDPASQPVEPGRCLLVPPRGLGELLLGAMTHFEEAGQGAVAALALERGGGLAPLHLRKLLLEALELRRSDAGAEAVELDAELLRPLGGGRLQRQRAQALAHLVLEIAGALGLDLDARELELRAVAAALELPEPGGFLDERASLCRLRGEDLLDAALADDGVHPATETDVGQKLDHVGPAHVRPVDKVLALTAAREPPRDRDLGELERAVTVLVVEEKLDLGKRRRLAAVTASVQDVVRLLRPELARAQAAGGPNDRVADVRLARAVRADDHGDARLEAHLDRVRKRLEATQLDRTQVHAGQSDYMNGRPSQ